MKIQVSIASHRPARRKGFSLVEMLVVIAVMGILAGVLINYLALGGRDVIVETVYRRNAQSFATICTCAQLGGADPVVGTDVIATMRKISDGVTPVAGPMAGKQFVIKGLTDDDIAGASYYLSIQSGELVYDAAKPIKRTN